MSKAQPKRKASAFREAERGFQVPTVVVDDLAELSTPTVEQVWVHVYEIGQDFLRHRRRAKTVLGAFHTGVEVFGREWSFGTDHEQNSCGITWSEPRNNALHNFRETLQLGYTTCSPKKVIQIIDEMREEWRGEAYDTMHANSHHFSEALCRRLGASGLPAWLHDLAQTTKGVKPGRVSLRVYDLGQTVLTRGYNAVNKSYGAFHTGVEVYGREWSFGAAPVGYSGIGENPPGENTMHSFRETLVMGYTPYNPEQITQIIQELAVEWPGTSYELFSRNCHNFSDAFCRRLGVPGVPSWVNDLASSLAPRLEATAQPAETEEGFVQKVSEVVAATDDDCPKENLPAVADFGTKRR
mmetsp:Transcript_42336/g.95524  ORF Transcript_42336/g.95524 Transcript_42336/m.95524 type:complete len:354 (+) Transcript_42336:106-1167(+)